jgi:hypothetical protein
MLNEIFRMKILIYLKIVMFWFNQFFHNLSNYIFFKILFK